jgi:hypothetical protein
VCITHSPPKRPSHKCGERVVATRGSLCCKGERASEPSDGTVRFCAPRGKRFVRFPTTIGAMAPLMAFGANKFPCTTGKAPLRDFFGFVVIIMFPVRRVSNVLQRYTVDRVRCASTDGPLSKDKFKILVLGGGASHPTPTTT